MAKGDSGRAQNTINTQGQIAQNSQNNLANQTQQQYNQYAQQVPQANQNAMGNFNDIMNQYRAFLGMGTTPGGNNMQPGGGGMNENSGFTMPNFGTPTGNPYGGENGGISGGQNNGMTGGFTPPGDPNRDAIAQVFAKYGKSDTGPGTGNTDMNYWVNDALKNAKGDIGYVTDRLSKDFAGNGMDSAGGGFGSPMSGYGALNPAIMGYGDFASTGGFSDQDKADLRARAIAPTRAIYQNAQDELNRSKSLSGGYMPNAGAASSQMARNMSNQIGDINQNTDASIAQMVQSGRLAGLGGLSNIGLTGVNQGLQGMSGMNQAYGTTPGIANMLQQGLLGSGQQSYGSQSLQNQIAQMIMNAQLGKSQIPGDFAQGMGNVSGLLGGVGSLFTGIGAL